MGFLAGPPVKMSWGAIFGGAVSALAVWALLYSLGLALGLSAIDPENPGSIRGTSVFTGIWSILSPLIALFVGGMVAGHSAGIVTRVGGAVHGLVMWGITTLAGAWLLTNLLSAIVGGMATVGRTAVQAGAQGVASAVGRAGGIAETFGLDADDALRPVNERLRAEGKPPVTADQLQEAARDVVQEGLREGRFNRELLISNLAQNTALSRADAEEVATRVEAQFEGVRERLSTAAETVQTGALRAADATGKALWGVFGALLLGMVSAILGASTGVSRRQRAWAEAASTPPPVGPPSPGIKREVYP
jgi:hypothetical protein